MIKLLKHPSMKRNKHKMNKKLTQIKIKLKLNSIDYINFKAKLKIKNIN